jgi:hypothetical protein
MKAWRIHATAWQGLFKHGDIQSGQRVLILIDLVLDLVG